MYIFNDDFSNLTHELRIREVVQIFHFFCSRREIFEFIFSINADATTWHPP